MSLLRFRSTASATSATRLSARSFAHSAPARRLTTSSAATGNAGSSDLRPRSRHQHRLVAESARPSFRSNLLPSPFLAHQSRHYATPTEDKDSPDKKPSSPSEKELKKEDGEGEQKLGSEFEESIERGLREAKEGKKDDIPKELKGFFDKDGKAESGKESEDVDGKKASSSKKKSDKKGSSKESAGGPTGSPFGGPAEIRMNGNTIVATVIATYLVYRLTSSDTPSREITWQEFRTAFLDKGLVDRLVVVNRTRVKVYLHSNATGSMYPSTTLNGGPSPAANNNAPAAYWFSVGSVEAFERKLDDAQRELGIPTSERIPVAYHEEISTASTLLHFAPTILLAGLLFYMTRRAAGGAMGGGGGGGPGGIFGIGKSRAKMFNQETDVKTKFADVAGMDEAKEEIMEFVKFLKTPEKYEKLGAKIPRGAILSGPPGTGKTLLAKATAGEAEVPFLSVSGSEFVEMVSIHSLQSRLPSRT